jgi:tRNA A37 N6-isopentenylltransferase MiaA
VSRRVYVYFLLTFILGIIAGGAGVYYYAMRTGHWHTELDQQHVVSRMKRDLKLDDSQAQRLSAILEDYFRKRKELDRQHIPEYGALRQQTRTQVRQILNPDQLARFNEHVRHTDERLARERSEGK